MLYISWDDDARTDIDRRRTVGSDGLCDTVLPGIPDVALVVESLTGYGLVEDVSGTGALTIDDQPVTGRRVIAGGTVLGLGPHTGTVMLATVEAATDGLITRRQLECIACLADGKTLDETAEIIGVTHSTVSSHLQQAYRRLGVDNRREAVAVAFARGLFPDRRRGHAPEGLYAAITGAGGASADEDGDDEA